jgi:hypothetical protein
VVQNPPPAKSNDGKVDAITIAPVAETETQMTAFEISLDLEVPTGSSPGYFIDGATPTQTSVSPE